MVITSVSNDKIKEICKLNEKKYRDSMNLFLAPGEHLVEEASKCNLLEEVIILDGEDFSFDVNKIYVSDNVMKKICGMDSYPKIIGICKKREVTSLGDNILILEDIQDPGNLGTIIRSSMAFGVSSIIVSPKTVDLYNSKVIRSTQGMIFQVNFIVRDIEESINELHMEGYKVYGTNVINGLDIKSVDVPVKHAIVIGNEGSGLSDSISKLCDDNLYIRMNEKVESLNAGVATSILLYEVYNK